MTSKLSQKRNRTASVPSGCRLAPLPLRLLSIALISLQVLLPGSPQAWAAVEALTGPKPAAGKSDPQTTQSPDPFVSINRTTPKPTPPSTKLSFSSSPSEDEIIRSHVFGEPLAPIGPGSLQDNREMAQALVEYSRRTNPDDFSAITSFLSGHPGSPWRASLLTQLGVDYRHTGWFSKALDSWEEARSLAKAETNPSTKIVADQAVTELLELNARLGRYERLNPLLAELEHRDIHPAFSERIRGVRAGLWLMTNRPEQAFRCGPMALGRIWASHLSPEVFGRKILESRSTPKGISLDNVCQLANELGMNYQIAHRQPGSAIILPAVVHWKVGHYASLLRTEGDKYLVDDPTFGDAIWVSQAALDAEASGYFLIPAGSLPAGWTTVGIDEAKTVWGKGTTQSSDPSCTSSNDKKSCQKKGTPMAQYAFHLMLASLNIVDTPVGYSPPRGPAVFFKVTYNQREAGAPLGQPATFTFSNMGQKWTFDWLSYITDDPQTPQNPAYCYLQGGGYEPYTGFNSTSHSYAPQVNSHTILVRTSSTSYERDLPDGSKQLFSLPDGSSSFPRKVFITQEIDPYGNSLTYTYDSNFRLVSLTDVLGQVTTLSYGLANDILKITQVTDPFGRNATFQYDGSGRLTDITDILGITSHFTYSNSFITSLTTPYGTTTFATGGDPLDARNAWIEATDPLGKTERAFFVNLVGVEPGCDVYDQDPSSLVPTGLGLFNGYLSARNTFYWDKEAMRLYPGDFAKARIYHWLHSTDANACSGTLECTKNPLEVRVWHTYPGQTTPYVVGTNGSPSAIGRVLDDGSSQICQFQYNNPFGKVTRVTDPAGRVTLFTYATNQFDLLQVAQQVGSATQVLSRFTYSTNHLPLTSVDAAGQTNYFGYNGYGQLTALTNALGQVSTLAYDTNGYLTNATGALPGATTSFAYDAYGRVRTVTDSTGYSVTTDYDAANRPTRVTYPDNTYSQVVYYRLDPVLARDRRAHWSLVSYDPLRRVTDTMDALGRSTHFEWCGCGSLSSITDPMGSITTWVRDLEGRVTAKIYPDSTQVNNIYETNTSRLKSVTDAKAQTTFYQYFVDDNLKQVSYSNCVVATPSVSFTYDTNYNRLLTMTDGVGTTTYSYYTVTNGQLGAGSLQSVDGPLTNDTISYLYDALGRATNRAINNIAQTVAFDALGRVTSETNALGTFAHAYVGTTSQIATNSFPNGQRTVFSYFGATNDNRLQQIQNLLPNGQNLSSFSHGFDADGQITTWTHQTDTNAPTVLSLRYDSADQLLTAILTTNTASGAVLNQYLYGYDSAGNRLTEEIQKGSTPPFVTGASFNSLNQLTNLSGSGGPILFSGSLDKPGTVTVNGVAARVDPHTTNFVGYANVSVGTNVVQVAAADSYGNSRTNNYQIIVTNNGVAQTITFDLNGNQVSAVTGSTTNTYEWDGADRLTAINAGTNRSEFIYDGSGRRVRIVEKQNGTVVSTTTFAWVGMSISEERDSTGGTVNKRFFAQGQINGTTNLFYGRDHLGSVREMTDASGNLRTRYDYDPYGKQTKILGDLNADFGFTGHYLHSASGLYLSPYREYTADNGRWLSRDPIGEAGGINLYGYVGNDPINALDPLGLWSWSSFGIGAAKGIVGIGVGVAVGAIVVATLAPAAVAALGIAAAGYGGFVAGQTLYEAVSGKEWTWSGNGRSLCDDELSEKAGEAVVDVLALGSGALGAARNALSGAAKSTSKIDNLVEAVEDFLGGEGKIIKNADGDTILMRGDKKIRFDINDPHGDKPHFHLEQQTPSGKWKDAGSDHRYYFQEE